MGTKPNGNQTVPTGRDVDEFVESIEDERQRADARVLIGLMSDATGEPAAMWGPAIIGFGSRHWRYESGREGDSPVVAFSPRRGKFALYLTDDASAYADELAAMGRTSAGKGCIYVRRLEDVRLELLADLIRRAAAEGGGC